MLMLFYFVCDFTLSWLYDKKSLASTGTTNVGKTEAGLTSTTYDFYLPSSGAKSATTNSIIKNTGTTKVLLRCFYAVYMDADAKTIATSRHLNDLVINSSFLPSDENIAGTYSGVYYYNSYLEAGQSVSLINSMTPAQEGRSKKVTIKITAEMVDAEGGVYKMGSRDPWKNTPAGWFANNSYLIKTASKVVGPKLTLNWEDVSKITLTGWTGTNNSNMLFCTYNSAWIGISQNSWTFTGIKGNADIPATTFVNSTKTFHTVNFTITEVPDAYKNKGYIGLIWDSVWSKEVAYSNIKFYDHDGNLLYNLYPDPSGKFYDTVSKSVLPMSSWSGTTASSSTDTYYTSKHMEYKSNQLDGTLESYDAGTFTKLNNQTENGTMSVVSTGAFEGQKCLKITAKGGNQRVYFYVDVLKGRKYRFSVMYKSSMPHGTTTGLNKTVSYGIATELNGGDYNYQHLSIMTSSLYSCSGEWEWLYSETDTLTSNANLFCFIQCPVGYDVYVDSIYLQEI